jgi:hypothetical protein
MMMSMTKRKQDLPSSAVVEQKQPAKKLDPRSLMLELIKLQNAVRRCAVRLGVSRPCVHRTAPGT